MTPAIQNCVDTFVEVLEKSEEEPVDIRRYVISFVHNWYTRASVIISINTKLIS